MGRVKFRTFCLYDKNNTFSLRILQNCYRIFLIQQDLEKINARLQKISPRFRNGIPPLFWHSLVYAVAPRY